MEMGWCLIALKPMYHFLLIGVCVATRHRMIVWQGSCQMKCVQQKSHGATVEGCAALKISSVVLVF
jgi:hypothetical protein